MGENKLPPFLIRDYDGMACVETPDGKIVELSEHEIVEELNRLTAENVRLEKQVAKAQSYREASKEAYALIVTQLAGMKHANKRQREMTNRAWRDLSGLRRALEFYADEEKYDDSWVDDVDAPMMPTICADEGKIARAALDSSAGADRRSAKDD